MECLVFLGAFGILVAYLIFRMGDFAAGCAFAMLMAGYAVLKFRATRRAGSQGRSATEIAGDSRRPRVQQLGFVRGRAVRRGVFGILLVFGFCMAVLAAVAWTGLLPRGTPLDFFAPETRFVSRWRSELRFCPAPAAAELILKDNKEGGEVVRMADGSWVAVVMEHACCTGAGFNATLYVSSTGEAWLDSATCYCGWMPLGDELAGYPATGVADFIAAVNASKPIVRL